MSSTIEPLTEPTAFMTKEHGVWRERRAAEVPRQGAMRKEMMNSMMLDLEAYCEVVGKNVAGCGS